MRAITTIALLLFAAGAPAEISIDELVREAGIREGQIAVKELPRWQGARKILLRRVSIADADALRTLPARP